MLSGCGSAYRLQAIGRQKIAEGNGRYRFELRFAAGQHRYLTGSRLEEPASG
jgi:hypothetical protein